MIYLESDLQYSEFSITWHPTFDSFTTWRPNVCKAQPRPEKYFGKKIISIFFSFRNKQSFFVSNSNFHFNFPISPCDWIFNQHKTKPVNTNLAKFPPKTLWFFFQNSSFFYPNTRNSTLTFFFLPTLWKFFFGHLDFFSHKTLRFFLRHYIDTWHFFLTSRKT